jgi:hypothetical protein
MFCDVMFVIVYVVCCDFLLDLFACKFTLGDVYLLKLLRTVTFYVM